VDSPGWWRRSWRKGSSRTANGQAVVGERPIETPQTPSVPFPSDHHRLMRRSKPHSIQRVRLLTDTRKLVRNAHFLRILWPTGVCPHDSAGASHQAEIGRPRSRAADARAGAWQAASRLLSTAISFGIDQQRTLAVEGQGRAGRGLSNPSCPPIQAERCIRVHLVRACPPVLRQALLRRSLGLQPMSGPREHPYPRLPDRRQPDLRGPPGGPAHRYAAASRRPAKPGRRAAAGRRPAIRPPPPIRHGRRPAGA
jgi:hypothetical protein